MKYLHGNILCLEGFEFIKTEKNPEGLVPEGTYKSLQQRSKIILHSRGGGAGNHALIEYESLPDAYKAMVIAKYGDPYEYMARQPIRELIKTDYKAVRFFQDFTFENGKKLKPEHQLEYANDAAILNAFTTLLSDKKKLKTTLNIKLEQFWETACNIISGLKDAKERFPNSLPTSVRRLKPHFKAYKTEGYAALISGKYLNDNRRKVDEALERLILSIYVQNNKPYAKEVHDIYCRFMAGQVEVFDAQSGELFQPIFFATKDGQPIDISETTVWAYINKPMNRMVVDNLRTKGLEYNNRHRPYIHRHAPVYAFSKITMDDIAIPYKMPNGDRVWSYQIFDVASKCVVGKSFGKDKSRGLFLKAVQEMFRTIHANGWGIPAEIEIEQHISNTFADDLLSEGNVFPFVRFCRGGNPQEKRAEHIIKGKKYALQAKREGFQRRPFARLEANRMNEDKDTVRYSYSDIVANELSDINAWNNQLHHDQEKYPGLTRWQVLQQSQNPDLLPANPATISRYVGHHTETSILRSQYATVKNTKYHLPNVQCLSRLQPNNWDVDAYYLPDADGAINEVHLYQNDEYICTCGKLATFNEARAEQTEADIQIRNRQFAYRTSFDNEVRRRKEQLHKIGIIHKPLSDSLPMPATLVETSLDEGKTVTIPAHNYGETDPDYWEKQALNNL